jgi:hypothetical protein
VFPTSLAPAKEQMVGTFLYSIVYVIFFFPEKFIQEREKLLRVTKMSQELKGFTRFISFPWSSWAAKVNISFYSSLELVPGSTRTVPFSVCLAQASGTTSWPSLLWVNEQQC